jgi:hypothetical protein
LEDVKFVIGRKDEESLILSGMSRRHRIRLREEWFAVKKSEEKQIKELLSFFKKMNFVEIMGFGKLL